MGFCRRCGDIVNGQRCSKCGGSAVAPSVSLSQDIPQKYQDKWSRTYVSRDTSMSSPRPKSRGTSESTPHSSSSLIKHFPGHVGPHITGLTSLDRRITHHIASTASQSTRSTLKPTVTGPKPESGILPSLKPNDTTLSKVYGSVLQPKDSLAMHCCATCATPFLPDATIYPDPLLPASDEPRFLCRQCFIVNGGSKGLCPECNKPVTILKAEGGFVYAADKYWHKKCFNCGGCSKNIGDSPVVDLIGRPSCSECFEKCLSRDSCPPKQAMEKRNRPSVPTERRNPGGFELSNTPSKFRDSSPAIEELEHRFGISRSREGSPAIEELSQRLNSIGKDHQIRYSSPSSPTRARSVRLENNSSPACQVERLGCCEPDKFSDAKFSSISGIPRRTSSSSAPPIDAIENMKKRFTQYPTTSPTLATVISSESDSTMSASPVRPGHSTVYPKNRLNSKIPIPIPQTEPTSPSSSTSEFMTDASDILTQSSFLDSPLVTVQSLSDNSSRYNNPDILDPDNVIIEETNSQLNTPTRTPQSTIKVRPSHVDTLAKNPLKVTTTVKVIGNVPASATCAKCEQPLFALQEGGKFVTVPGNEVSDIPQTFHKDCFKCAFCGKVFNESGNGQAIFVKSNAGPAHIECTPTEKIVIRKSLSAGSLRFSHEKSSPKDNSSTIQSPTRKSGGNRSSSRYEHPPPAAPVNAISVPRFGSRTVCPGCQKFVSLMERGVIPGPQGSRWHAECLVCGGKRPQSRSNSWVLGRGEERKKEPGCGKKLDSAAKTDADGRTWCRQCLLTSRIGGSSEIPPAQAPLSSVHTSQENKSTPQMTGTTTLARQFTGLGNSDAGLLKQLTGGSISPTRSLSPTKQLCLTTWPRPRSVIGMRSSKSVDEGRGMFLVRQLTGASSSNPNG